MLTLFMAAQVEAIDSGVETVDATLLKSVYRDQMKPLHQIINALRSGDMALLNNFDDLYIKAFSDLNNDSKLSRLALVQKNWKKNKNDNSVSFRKRAMRRRQVQPRKRPGQPGRLRSY